MNNGFVKFKRKLLRGALTVSVLFGASFGVFAAAVLLLVAKLNGYSLSPLLYVAVGGGVAVLHFAVALLLLRPSDKKIARRLDEQLQTRERVQTMLAFKDAEGDMVELQRKDTDLRLEHTPTGAVKAIRIWKHLFSPLLAGAMMAVAMLVPMKVITTPEPPPPPPYDEGWDKDALYDLIEAVKKSNMQELPKAETVAVLVELAESLESFATQEEAKRAAKEVIVAVDTVVERVNTARELAEAMKKSTSEKDDVRRLGSAIGSMSGNNVRMEMERLQKLFVEAKSNERKGALEEFARELRAALERAEVSQEDALYRAVYSLLLTQSEPDTPDDLEDENTVDSLEELIAVMEDYRSKWAQDKLNGIFPRVQRAIVTALGYQCENRDTADMVIRKLMSLFDIRREELPAELFNRDSENDYVYGDGDDDKELNDGGYSGDGGASFGSDDLIYFPDENIYIKYSDVIHLFENEAQGKSFESTEELERALAEYFSKLNDGLNKEEG